MPRREGGFSLPVVLIGTMLIAVAVGGYFFASEKNQKSETISPKPDATETKEEVKEPARDYPQAVEELLDSADIAKVEEAGMTVYRGNNPPDIEGSYQFDSLVVTYDSESQLVGREVSADQYQYYGQRGGAVKIIYDDEKIYDGISGPKGYISGKGQCFTIFLETKNEPEECGTREVELTSACKVDQGLGQVKRAGILKAKGTACDLIRVDGLRIASETDGLANRLDE